MKSHLIVGTMEPRIELLCVAFNNKSKFRFAHWNHSRAAKTLLLANCEGCCIKDIIFCFPSTNWKNAETTDATVCHGMATTVRWVLLQSMMMIYLRIYGGAPSSQLPVFSFHYTRSEGGRKYRYTGSAAVATSHPCALE